MRLVVAALVGSNVATWVRLAMLERRMADALEDRRRWARRR